MPESAEVKLGDLFASSGQDASNLLCPSCGDFYMHQKGVTVFDRNEDDETCFVTAAARQEVMVKKRAAPDNPSPRRQGMTIYFRCEFCTPIFKLHIAQHKGVTMLNWSWREKA